ncbi:SCO4848 family membrane protein [Nocardioides sp. P5_C9_2]
MSMTLTRRHGLFLVGVAAWNALTWGMFTKNLYAAHAAGEDRPAGYWIAHTGLIVANLVLGGVFAVWGAKVLRSRS